MALERKKIKSVSAVNPKRGEVYLVNFDPTIGAKIQKARPALVLQNDVANRYGSVTIVAAITSRSDKNDEIYPTEVPVHAPEGGLGNDSLALLNQMRTIDKQRLSKRLGMLRGETMERVDTALRISLDIKHIT